MERARWEEAALTHSAAPQMLAAVGSWGNTMDKEGGGHFVMRTAKRCEKFRELASVTEEFCHCGV